MLINRTALTNAIGRILANMQLKGCSQLDIYNSYKAWCSMNGHNAVSATRFTKDLKSKAMIAGDGYFAQMKGYPAIRIEMKARQIGFSN